MFLDQDPITVGILHARSIPTCKTVSNIDRSRVITRVIGLRWSLMLLLPDFLLFSICFYFTFDITAIIACIIRS